MKKALLFPGQGSQAIGMGRDLCDAFEAAREVFEEVDDALSFKLSDIIWNGTPEDLTQTQNAQPALMAMSVASWRVLQSMGVKLTDFSYAAGHSLGEYSALCVAGALPLSETARLLRARGQAMAEAAISEKGLMAAIIGLEADAVATLAKETGCYVANDNSVGQIVISGDVTSIEKACEKAKEMGAKRALPLNVAGAFHSPLMQSAADKMKDILADAAFKAPIVPVISNITAEPVCEVAQIKELLYLQITGQVRWRETVQFLKKDGVFEALEVGAGKVLAGLVKRTEPEINVFSVGDLDSVEEFEKTLK